MHQHPPSRQANHFSRLVSHCESVTAASDEHVVSGAALASVLAFLVSVKLSASPLV